MPKIRVRKKNQITIPLRIAEEAGIKPDDVLDISYANGVVTVMPAGKTRGSRSIMDYAITNDLGIKTNHMLHIVSISSLRA